MSWKVRAEYLRFSPPSYVSAGERDNPAILFGATSFSGAGATPFVSDPVPTFGDQSEGLVRLTGLSGAAILAWGDAPAATEDAALRLAAGERVTLHIKTGQRVALIEAADGPASAGGAFSGVLAAGESHVGEVGAAGAHPTFAPTATALTYAAGKCVGALFTLPAIVRVAGRGALVQSATLRSASGTAAVDLVLFRDNPTASTLTDNATFTVAAADLAKVSKVVSFTSWASLGAGAISNLDGVGKYLTPTTGAGGYGVLVARGALTLTAASDVTGSLGLIQD